MIDVDGAAYPFYKTTTHTHTLKPKNVFYEWKLGCFKTLCNYFKIMGHKLVSKLVGISAHEGFL